MRLSSHDYIIRFATRSDADQLVTLALELVVHEGDSVEWFERDRFVEDAFGSTPQFSVLVAVRGPDLVGYALFHDAYEPSHAARGVYLCDLYVRPGCRRRGIGRALLAHVAKDGAARGRSYVWWVARESNDPARAFYRTVTNVEQHVTAHAITYEMFQALATEA
jgi:ribosomal protein S18 acetylase RimI-like enzyme